MSLESKLRRSIFVIMPFEEAYDRRRRELDSFFENNLKKPIENADLKYSYRVYRSGEDFNITQDLRLRAENSILRA